MESKEKEKKKGHEEPSGKMGINVWVPRGESEEG